MTPTGLAQIEARVTALEVELREACGGDDVEALVVRRRLWCWLPEVRVRPDDYPAR